MPVLCKAAIPLQMPRAMWNRSDLVAGVVWSNHCRSVPLGASSMSNIGGLVQAPVRGGDTGEHDERRSSAGACT